MRIASLIKLFVPPIFHILRKKLLFIHRSLVRGMLPQIEHSSERMVIIGNGPSLKRTMEKYKKQISECDIIVVNEFGATDYYEALKPSIYVFADPAYFTLPDNIKESVLSLFENIVTKTTWRLHIIIPFSYKNSKCLEIFGQNKNITIDCYYDGEKNIGNKTKFEAWDENLIAPPAQTVLNTCIYLSIYWNYKEVFLVGADSSFLESLRIDQITNDIYINNSHFYQEEDVYSSDYYDASKGIKMEGWSLHNLIWAYGNMFKMYEELKEYADYKGVNIYNASEYSWINVFERKKLK